LVPIGNPKGSSLEFALPEASRNERQRGRCVGFVFGFTCPKHDFFCQQNYQQGNLLIKWRKQQKVMEQKANQLNRDDGTKVFLTLADNAN
jgi:hypothetical protein